MITPSDVVNYIDKAEYATLGLKTRVCCLTLKNGIEVVGHAHCQSDINDDELYGKETAFQNAVQQAYPLVISAKAGW